MDRRSKRFGEWPFQTNVDVADRARRCTIRNARSPAFGKCPGPLCQLADAALQRKLMPQLKPAANLAYRDGLELLLWH